jgi:hypothetical protein
MLLKTKDACPRIPDHHLYNIHIPVIIPRRVVDAFVSCSLPPFVLAVCCCLAPATLRFFYLFHFRVGPSTAVSKTNGPSFATLILLPPIFTSYFTCITSFVILCCVPFSPHLPTPVILRVPCLISSFYDLPLELILALALFRGFAFFGLQLSYHLASWTETLPRLSIFP